jgi:NAD(P)H-nitrite reductase large subunit
MNLHGISLVVIGIPLAGAQRSIYSRPETGVYRELYHSEGRIVGGALIGDITNGGRLHSMMNIGQPVDTDFEDLLQPRIDTFSKWSPSCSKYNRRATFLPPQGV